MRTTVILLAILTATPFTAAGAEAQLIDMTQPREGVGPAPGPMPTIPSGNVPTACWGRKVHRLYTELLPCYLNDPSNAQLANFVRYDFGTGHEVSWKDWSAASKAELAQTFADTIRWYDGGMVSYDGVQAPDVPANIEQTRVAQGVHGGTVYDPAVRWQIYRARIALTLAMEIYAWVPWSFYSYLEPASSLAFSPFFVDQMIAKTYVVNNTVVVLGKGPRSEVATGNPLAVFKFLKTRNLIGATRRATIELILDWSRVNLAHMFGAYTAQNFYAYWQYWGYPPVHRILNGTVTTMPGLGDDAYLPHSWTKNCYGTTHLLIELFRTINIPVTHASVGRHLAPYFQSERMYLTHGDDPYSQLSKSSRPVAAFLIDKSTYAAWFPGVNPQAEDVNVGRGPLDDNIRYPSPYLVQLYKLDLQDGATRANGKVYETYRHLYTVAQLEQKGLWINLEAAVRGGYNQY